MLQRLGLTDEEMVADHELGYPRGYAKLCRRFHIQMPYDDGPPITFLPYALCPQNMVKLKEMNLLFPTIVSEETDQLDTRKYVDSLWTQLDHLGNAGFDPAKFRVDPYGNVLYFHADAASPLAWEVDHWFPYSRGGKTVPNNLRLVQWQVHNMKRDKLEFLVPWWDLQLGVSVNQFLSIFASNIADFRQRAFSLLFFAGENEQLDEITVVECHSWPQHFLEKKRQFGVAPAAIVRVQKDTDDTRKPLNISQPMKRDTHSGRRWTVEEDEALCRAIQKFRPGNSTETKELEPVLVSKSTAQLSKFRLRKEDWELDKENIGDLNNIYTAFSTALQKETYLKMKREEEILQKQEEITLLDQELMQLKQRSEAERLVLEDLESVLIKHRRRVEKHRHLAETQASYRQCMEKMIRDMMHQSIVYKEQLRLNQAACNALMARLESLKANSDTSEREFLKKLKQREDIQVLLRPYSEQMRKRLREDDAASCCKYNVKKEVDKMPPYNLVAIPGTDYKESLPMPLNKTTNLLKDVEEGSKRIQKELRLFLEEDQEAAMAETLLDACKGQLTYSIEKKTAKKKSRLLELEGSEIPAMIVRHEHQGAKAESTGDNAKEDGPCEAGEEDLDEMLQEVITMQGEAEAAMADANAEEAQEDEEERIRRVGKSNLDKWLQMLLQNTQAGVFVDEVEGKSEDVVSITAEEVDDKPTGLLGELQNKQNFKWPGTEHRKPSETQGAEEKEKRTKRSVDRVQQSLNPGPLKCKEEENSVPREKEHCDDLDLSENFRCLNLECNDEVDAELYQQHRLAIAMRMETGAGIQKKKKTEVMKNSDLEFHKKEHREAAIIRNSDSEFQEEEHKAAATIPTVYADSKVKHGVLDDVSQQQERVLNNHTIDQMAAGGEGVALGNADAYDSIYQTDHKTPGGTTIRSSGIAGPTVQKGGARGNNGDSQVLQQKGNEGRLKRSHSMRVRPGFMASAAVASPLFWWGDHRGGHVSGRKMWVFGQDGENEGGGRTEDLKRSGEDPIKIGVKASIKSCTRAWKRTVKKGGRLPERID